MNTNLNTSYNRLIIIFVFLLIPLNACQQGDNYKGPKAEIGKAAPDFTLNDTTEQPWSLSGLKGKVVFVNFWATWCPPCREEMPSMEKLRKKMASEQFQMLAVLYDDDPGEAAAFVNGYGYKFPILIDPDGKMAKTFGLTGIPETFVINTEGVVVERFIGPRQWDTKETEEMLKRYLP